MVKDSRKTPGTDAFKPVNAPGPVRVEEDSRGFPAAVRTARKNTVVSILERWRIDDEWWRDEPVSRLYFDVLLEGGQRMVVYKDLASGQWHRQGY